MNKVKKVAAPTTVPIRKYNTLLGNYSKLLKDYTDLEQKANEYAGANLKLSGELEAYRKRDANTASIAGPCTIQKSELQIAEEITGKLCNLRPGARRTALAAVLSGLIENEKAVMIERESQLHDIDLGKKAAKKRFKEATSNYGNLLAVISSNHLLDSE